MGSTGFGSNVTRRTFPLAALISVAMPVALAWASPGDITTVAGSSTRGSTGDGGPATIASLGTPKGVALDHTGGFYISDNGQNRIRRVDSAGTISTAAGTGAFDFVGDGNPATAAAFRNPQGIAVDAVGNLYIADRGNNRVRRVDVATGVISTFAGNGTAALSGDGGPAVSAGLASPADVAVDSAGNVYIADSNDAAIRKVDMVGKISTVAGNGTNGFGGDGGPASAAKLAFPEGVTLDGRGNLYIGDTANNRIRKVDTAGIISTFAGNGTHGFGGDGGPATAASLSSPTALGFDADENLFFADRDNYRVRKVNASGVTSTVAGNGTQGYSGDGGPATAAQLVPYAVAIDSAGNLLIPDAFNGVVRRVEAAAPAVLPEVPMAAMLLVVAAGLLGLTAAVRRRPRAKAECGTVQT